MRDMDSEDKFLTKGFDPNLSMRVLSLVCTSYAPMVRLLMDV